MTPPAPGGPNWQPPAPGAERDDDRPAWLQQAATGPGEGPRGWSPTQPPPEPPRGRRVGALMATLVLLLVVGLAAGGLVFATRREQPAATAGGAT
ncbi:MAG TPA: hypothetical protein VF512_08670, partial [Actinomycetota bacterium]